MYTLGIFDRFAAHLEESGARVHAEEFRSAVEKIEFTVRGGVAICSGSAINDVLAGTPIEHLAAQLHRTFTQFITEEDILRPGDN